MENNIFFDNGINVNDVDYTQNVDSMALPNGWYKIQLVDVGEVKREAKGACDGAMFKFEVVAGNLCGMSFFVWFAVNVVQSSGAYRVNKFKTIFSRIAQCVGVSRLTSVSQVLGKPFFALIRQTTSTKTLLDLETAEERIETRYYNDFGTVPADSILSIEDYYRAFPPDNSTSDAFVKLDANGVDSGGSDGDLAVKASRKKTAKKPASKEEAPF